MADDIPAAKPKASRKTPILKAVVADASVAPDAAAASTVTLRKKELLDRVGAIAKVKKKDLREVVEATLQVLGEALARGEDLNLPPLGRAKVGRQKGVNGGDLYIVKLRRGTARAESPTESLADEAE